MNEFADFHESPKGMDALFTAYHSVTKYVKKRKDIPKSEILDKLKSYGNGKGSIW